MNRLILAGFCLSGASALIYEVVWTRALSLVMGSTTYALSAMLASFMTGLTIGGYIGGIIADRTKEPVKIFGLIEAGIAVFGLVTFIVIKKLLPLYVWVFYTFGLSFSSFSIVQFVFSLAVMLLPAALMGATLPLVLKARAEDPGKLGRDAGDVYSINNLGAVIGSFAAAFVIIPIFGVSAANTIAIGLNLIVASAILLVPPPSGRGRFGAGLIVLLLPISILAGCASKGNNEDARLKVIIVKYNNALIEAYSNQFFAPLKEVADKDQVRRVDIFIDSYLTAKQIMDAELLKIDFREIKIEGETALVRTSEDWSYRWINYRTKREVAPRKNIRQEIMYHIVKKDNRWLVKKVEGVK